LAASAYDFTKQLLTSQPKFTEKRDRGNQAAAGRQENKAVNEGDIKYHPHLRRPRFLAAPASTA
jgi:hypothetical protein